MEPAPENRRGLAQVSVAQISATLLGAIFWMVLAAIIHPVAYGYLSWLVSIATIISVICSVGLGKTIVTYFQKEKSQELLGGLVFLVSVLSVAAGAVTALVLGLPSGLLVVGLSVFSMAVHLELARRNYKKYMWLWVGVRALSLAIPLLFYWISGSTAGILVGMAAVYLVFSAGVLRHLRTSFGKIKEKRGFIYGAWGADVGGAAVSFLDKILIGSLFGMALLGYYNFAYRIFVLLGVLPQVLFFYLLPERSSGADTKRVEHVGIIFSFVLAVAVFLLAPVLIPLAFPGFTEGIIAVQLMALALIPATAVVIKSSEMYSKENTGVVLGSRLLAIGVGVVGISALGRHLGLLGLAVALLLLNIAMLSGLFFIPKLMGRGSVGKLAGGLIAMGLVTAGLLGSVEARSPAIEISGSRVQGTGVAMSTTVTVTAEDENTEKAVSAVRAAFDEINRLDEVMSTTNSASEIYALNSSGTEWVKVSPDVMSTIKRAKWASSISNGAFDLTVEPLVELWMDKVKITGREPSPSELQEAMVLVGWENLLTDDNSGTVRFQKTGMKVTLGGIAKGYAVDRAADILRQAGVENGLVAIGGEIQGFGPKVWKIAIQHPRIDWEYLGVLDLENFSISTSGDYRRFYFLGSTRVHHIIDPRTGRSADNSISVTVIAENSVRADALSTATFVLGPAEGKTLLDNLGLKGLIVSAEGQIVRTDAWDYPLLVTSVATGSG
ncbi:MAG: FAD:protein FMN transferase [Candidatus Hadarchaeota archaeon]